MSGYADELTITTRRCERCGVTRPRYQLAGLLPRGGIRWLWLCRIGPGDCYAQALTEGVN